MSYAIGPIESPPRRAPSHDPRISTRALFAYIAVGLWVGLLGTVGGLYVLGPVPHASAAVTSNSQNAGIDYLYLTIQLNPINGNPQYSPANFTIPRGEVHVTIVNYDAGASWPACPCNVSGTAGNVETVNGTTTHAVDSSTVSHTFFIPRAGVNVLVPQFATVGFTTWFNETGSYLWYCLMPCGAGTDASSTPPMGEMGWMAGTITVVA